MCCGNGYFPWSADQCSRKVGHAAASVLRRSARSSRVASISPTFSVSTSPFHGRARSGVRSAARGSGHPDRRARARRRLQLHLAVRRDARAQGVRLRVLVVRSRPDGDAFHASRGLGEWRVPALRDLDGEHPRLRRGPGDAASPASPVRGFRAAASAFARERGTAGPDPLPRRRRGRPGRGPRDRGARRHGSRRPRLPRRRPGQAGHGHPRAPRARDHEEPRAGRPGPGNRAGRHHDRPDRASRDPPADRALPEGAGEGAHHSGLLGDPRGAREGEPDPRREGGGPARAQSGGAGSRVGQRVARRQDGHGDGRRGLDRLGAGAPGRAIPSGAHPARGTRGVRPVRRRAGADAIPAELPRHAGRGPRRGRRRRGPDAGDLRGVPSARRVPRGRAQARPDDGDRTPRRR